MIKANEKIFQFYLAMMDSFKEFLSEKYSKSESIEDTKHYQTIIIEKIVRMFHSLELLTSKTTDEVSARCILRCIIDSVTTFCFIYQRNDSNEVIFRHFLYCLDGWRVYKNSVMPISEDNEYTNKEESLCDYAIKQIEEKLYHHPYYIELKDKVDTIIQKANWKYESLQNPERLSFGEMYSTIGFNSGSTDYYQNYLSQFVHGLCFSNKPFEESEQIKRVLYESIPIADKFIQAIFQNFHDNERTMHALISDSVFELLHSKNFNYYDLGEFIKELLQKNKTIVI